MRGNVSCGERFRPFWVLVVLQHYLNLYSVSSRACGFAVHLTEKCLNVVLTNAVQHKHQRCLNVFSIGSYSDKDRFVWITQWNSDACFLASS